MKHLPLNQFHENLVEEFNLTLKALGYNRSRDSLPPVLIREFLFYLERSKLEDVRTCSKKEIAAFFIYISERPNQRRLRQKLSDVYVAQFMYSIRKFFDFLIDIGEIENLPAYISKFYWGKKTEREILTEGEIIKLYKQCKTARDKAILALAYGCGLRRSEMTSLNVRDIIFSRSVLIVRDGKNHKNRTIPICENAKKDLQRYVRERFRKTARTKIAFIKVFYSQSEESRISVGEHLNIRLKNLVRMTFPNDQRLKRITLHSLRSSIAVHLIDRSAEITLVQRFLGHSSIDTTHLYAKRRRQRINLQNKVWTATNVKTRRNDEK